MRLDEVSLAPASQRERTAACTLGASLTLLVLAVLPWARTPLPPTGAFVTVVCTAIVVTAALTAVLLFALFIGTRMRRLGVLAAAFLFTGLEVAVYLCSFPGALAPDGLLAPGTAAAAWLWLFWHGGFGLWIAAYAGLDASIAARRRADRDDVHRTSLGIVVGVVGLVVASTIVAVNAAGSLPTIIVGTTFAPWSCLLALAPNAAVLAYLLHARARLNSKQTWLMIAVLAAVLEIVLTIFAESRYTLGWYISRCGGLVVSTIMLAALSLEMRRLYEGFACSAARMRAIIEGMSDSLILIDRAGRVRSANPAAHRTFGADEAALLGHCIDDLVPEITAIAGVSSGIPVESQGRRLDGGEFFAEATISAASDDDAGRHVVIVRDITARKIQRDLEAARDRAEEELQLKSEFVATVSHEIRTPLNALIGMTELLLDSELSDEQHDYAQVANQSSTMLLQMINDILDHSKLEAGKLDLDPLVFAPRLLVDEVRAMLAYPARNAGLELGAEVDAAVPRYLCGDVARLRQVIVNLVSNAVKFTERGSVVIRVQMDAAHPSAVRFSVADTGIGIAPETVVALFRPFAQGERSTARRFGGTGLGLSICKRLVEVMGGAIGVESVPGAGSTFWFTVSLPIADERDLRSDEPVAAVDLSRKVLVVDDDPINRRVLLDQLRRLGIAAKAVDDGDAAVDAVARGEYGLVLMDVNMPRMDGPTATRAIRSLGTAGASLPIVALTAALTGEARARCLAAGMNDFLSKPLPRNALRAALARWLPPDAFLGGRLIVEDAPPAREQRSLISAPIDLRRLYEFFESDEEELLAFLRDESVPHMTATIDELRAALARREADQAAALAHRAKGGSGTIGADQLATTMKLLQDAVTAGTWGQADELLRIAAGHVDAIAAWVAEHGADAASAAAPAAARC